MEEKDLREVGLEAAAEKGTYEPPEADVVRVEVQERVGGCNFSTIQVCGLTE